MQEKNEKDCRYPNRFKVTDGITGQIFEISADSPAQMNEWMEAINLVSFIILYYTYIIGSDAGILIHGTNQLKLKCVLHGQRVYACAHIFACYVDTRVTMCYTTQSHASVSATQALNNSHQSITLLPVHCYTKHTRPGW